MNEAFEAEVAASLRGAALEDPQEVERLEAFAAEVARHRTGGWSWGWLAAAVGSMAIVIGAVALMNVGPFSPASGSLEPSPDDYEIHIQSGLHLKMTAAEVVDQVRSDLSGNQAPPYNLTTPIDITSVEATTAGQAFDEVGSAASGMASDPVWLVRANGPLVGHLVPPGVKEPVSTTGYYIIDDATAIVRAYGFR